MDPCTISHQIARILGSQTFARKSQLRKLLELLHRNMDAQASLKTDQIIQQLWPGEIRTKSAADVATEMNRLRHALRMYYKAEGADDPVVISLPNRAVTAGNGNHERPWILAEVRSVNAPAREETRSRLRRAKAAIIASLLVVVVSAAAYLVIRLFALPDQPRSGRIEGSALIITNADGKELWRRNFPDGFGPDWFYTENLSWVGRTHVWFADLEGKGHTSVLFSYSPKTTGSEAHSSTLICYSDRGRERWRWSPGRDLPELNGSPATYLTYSLAILNATKKRPLRIVVASQHFPWWPSQIALLDSKGRTISEYWHSGELISMIVADPYGDGKQEIIAGGIANGYDHQATLVVLDPDHVSGASTEVLPQFQIHGMGPANERMRLLFLRSDLNRALYQYNQALDPTVEHGVLRLTVAECINSLNVGCQIWYEFDKNTNLIAAFAGGDEFRSAHNRFYATGKNVHTLSQEEQTAFLKVRCLVGCKSEFVPIGKLVP